MEGFQCGTPFVGYLMSAFDRENYAIYKDSSFQCFARMFGFRIPSDVGEKYEFYLATGDALRRFFREHRDEDITMLEAQDVIYVATEYLDSYRSE